MFCNKCPTQHDDSACFACENQPQKHPFILFGFRSNNIIKKIISVIYLSFVLLCMLIVLTDGKKGMISTADFLVDKIMSLLLFSLFLSPYIFLSNSKFRNLLPLFKQHKPGASFFGMVIVSFCLILVFGLTSSLHSSEYKADQQNHAYIETSKVPATCENDGYVNYLCEYCETTNEELIPATGHNYAEKSHIPATCESAGCVVNECVTCGKSETTTTPATGHILTQIDKKEPSTDQSGYIISACSICATQITTELPKSEPKSVETEALETEPDPTETIVPDTDADTPRQTTKETYISSCEPGVYFEIARYPQQHNGKNIYFRGYIMDVNESLWGDTTTYLIEVTQTDYGFWEDIVYVTYTPNADDPKLLEGDIVTFYGECKGDRTYITVLGDNPTVPYVEAKYIELEQP